MTCQIGNCDLPAYEDEDRCLAHHVIRLFDESAPHRREYNNVGESTVSQFLSTMDLSNWLDHDADEEIDHRNATLFILYGELPSYAYFTGRLDVGESREHWDAWWRQVLNSWLTQERRERADSESESESES